MHTVSFDKHKLLPSSFVLKEEKKSRKKYYIFRLSEEESIYTNNT